MFGTQRRRGPDHRSLDSLSSEQKNSLQLFPPEGEPRGAGQVNFTEGAMGSGIDFGMETPELHFPAPFAPNEEVMAVAETVVNIISAGGSIARALGHNIDTNRLRSPRDRAVGTMNFLPKKMFLAWEAGTRLEEQDWANCTMTVGSTGISRGRLEDVLPAARLAHRKPDLTVENLCWLYENVAAVIPLYIAIGKIDKAVRDGTSGVKGVTNYEFVELQATKKMISSLGMASAEITTGMKRLVFRAIATAQTHLQARLTALRGRALNKRFPRVIYGKV